MNNDNESRDLTEESIEIMADVMESMLYFIQKQLAEQRWRRETVRWKESR